MSRYGTFATGVLTSTELSENDLRSFFPLAALPMDAVEDEETTPYIWFTFQEAIEFVYRVKKIRIQIDLDWSDGGISDIHIDTYQDMKPAPASGERELVKQAFGLGLIGRSDDSTYGGVLTGTNLYVSSYKPSDQTFRMGFLFGTDVTHGSVSTATSTVGAMSTVSGTSLDIFGHSDVLRYPTSGTEPVMSGSIIVTPVEWREYLDADDLNAIWDSANGDKLIDPVPGDLG